MIAGAAEQSGNATLYVPILGSYELPAESSLRKEDGLAVLDRLRAQGTNPKRLWLKEVTVDLQRLDDLELNPSFVKIDVEGAELGVLRGMRNTIERSHPILMVERSDRFEQVASLLGASGYRAFAYDPRSDTFSAYHDQQTVNVFFLTQEDERP